MRAGSLFSGYGGLDLAVEAVLGATTAWHAQYEPPEKGKRAVPLEQQAPSRILAARWPGVPNLGDVTTVDWSTVEPVDVIAGGSPCQDVSHAGKRAGMRPGTRSGLWASMVDAVQIIRPRFVVWENVRGALSAEADSALESCPGCMGDGDDGPVLRALGRVLGDLADLGYDARWHGLRAADVGAPHGRFRIFLLAADAAHVGHERGRPSRRWGNGPADRCLAAPDADDAGSQGREPTAGRHMPARGATPDTDRDGREGVGRVDTGRCDTDRRDRQDQPRTRGESASCAATDPESRGEPCQPTRDDRDTALVGTIARAGGGDRAGTPPAGVSDMGRGARVEWGQYGPAIRRWEHVLGRVAPAPTERAPKGGQRLSPRFVEWMMGLASGWVTDVPGITRNEQLKALGNGVVPQHAEAALRAMLTACEVAA